MFKDRQEASMNICSDRIGQLRKQMKKAGIDVYYVPMSDCHFSEYIGDHFRCIEYLTGFTGSAGHVVITQQDAWLFADGRYYIQAENQLTGSEVHLMKWGRPDVPDPDAFLREQAKGRVLGFDGSVVSAWFAEKVSQEAKNVVFDRDLVGEIWTDRPAQTFSEIWEMPEEYCGESTDSKLERIRREISQKYPKAGNYIYLISSLDDIAWIFNIRADDIPNNPVAYAYAAVCSTGSHLLTHGNGYRKDWYRVEEAEPIQKNRGKCPADCVLLDKKKTGYRAYRYFLDNGLRILPIENIPARLKSIKNETEIRNLKNALLRDSAVVIRLMRWIKDVVGKKHLDELSVDEFLLKERSKDPLFLEPSFDTIAAYKENAAMMHYEASAQTAKAVEAEGMLLVDSGAQYKDGTTDITRTFILGPVSEEEKKSFTLTAVSMLRLMNARFIAGCRGENLDIIAREPMWREGLDYKCGTGHGVGHVLNVHEGPHCIRYRIGADGPSAVLEKGMVVTDEPGVYRENAFGVRTENELLVTEWKDTEDGRFLQFENLTFIPIDLDGIDPSLMSEEDKTLLNCYHQAVYDIMAPFFDAEMKQWLRNYTRSV